MAADDKIRFDGSGVGFISLSNQQLIGALNGDGEFIVPYDGWRIVMGYRSANNIYGTEFKLNGFTISNINITQSGDLIIPVKEGQKITWNSYARGSMYLFRMQY